tara:strand:+ start:1895 stop:3031 length:1137 start_codon:yes stop_codon:yes gene_type:complete
MALTDVFISPAGAGSKDGSSVANALQAIDSGDWSTDIEGLDRANKRFIFLEGTYAHTTKLTFSGSAPTDEQPNQWVGAKSDGTILRPKFDQTGLRLDLTNYPLFVNSSNTTSVDTEEHTYYKCLSFENTNASYNQGSIVESATSDIDAQMWFGCNFKAAPANDNAEVMVGNSTIFSMCVFESTTKQYDRILDLRSNTNVSDCRIIGGGTSSGSGDGDGVTTTNYFGKLERCVICNVHGHGFNHTATNNRSNPHIRNCSIINCGSDGIKSTPTDQASVQSGVIEGCIIFNCTGNGIAAGAGDDRQSGAQIAAMGSNGANFENMDSYGDMIDVIAITTADFIDYANDDFRIRRDSVLYNLYGVQNFGAIMNEDFEFVSVS